MGELLPLLLLAFALDPNPERILRPHCKALITCPQGALALGWYPACLAPSKASWWTLQKLRLLLGFGRPAQSLAW